MTTKLRLHLAKRHGYTLDSPQSDGELVEAHRWMHRRVWLCHSHEDSGRDPPGVDTGDDVVDRPFEFQPAA